MREKHNFSHVSQVAVSVACHIPHQQLQKKKKPAISLMR